MIPIDLYIAQVLARVKYFLFPNFTVHLHLAKDVLQVTTLVNLGDDESGVGILIVIGSAETALIPLVNSQIGP